MRSLDEYAKERSQLGAAEFALLFGSPALIGTGIVGEIRQQDAGTTCLALIAEELLLQGETVIGRVWLIRKGSGKITGPEIAVGRDRNNDVVIPEYSVSKRQGLFRCTPNGNFLIDLESRNGTVVNGKFITPFIPCQLHTGDSLRLGRLRCTFLTRQGFLECIAAQQPKG